MILTKRERVQNNVILCKKEYHEIMWRWILETFGLPEDTQNIAMSIDAIIEKPREFSEYPEHMSVEDKFILDGGK